MRLGPKLWQDTLRGESQGIKRLLREFPCPDFWQMEGGRLRYAAVIVPLRSRHIRLCLTREAASLTNWPNTTWCKHAFL